MKLTELYEGPVIDNVDPRKLGRVRVRIPGVADQGTGWAHPLGWPGAGGPGRGGWAPPPIGAEVAVLFKNGDPDHPRYLCGFPGEGEAPQEVQESSPEDAVRLQVIEGERWKLVLDERAASSRVAIEDRLTGDVLEIDGKKLGVRIKSTSALIIECDGAVDLRGSTITLNGRRVAPSTKPI